MTYVEVHKILSKSLCLNCLIFCFLEFHRHFSKSYTALQTFYIRLGYPRNALLIDDRILKEIKNNLFKSLSFTTAKAKRYKVYLPSDLSLCVSIGPRTLSVTLIRKAFLQSLMIFVSSKSTNSSLSGRCCS